MKLSEPYSKRPVRCCGVREGSGWKLKLYSIAYRNESPRPEVFEAAIETALYTLQQPPITDNRYGVGFLIAHEGRDGCWCLVDWWGNEDIIYHRLYAASHERPHEMRLVTDGRTACIWETAVWNFERLAWMESVLANPDGPDLERYLALQMNEDV